MAAIASKRKRESSDLLNVRPAPAMNTSNHDFDSSYLQTDDDGEDNTDASMDFAAVLAQHNANTTGEVENPQEHVQHAAQDQTGQSGGQSASDTAAAAMAQYHTMTVPQSTEQSFMTQNAGNIGDNQGSSGADQSNSNAQRRTSSFGDFDVSPTGQGQNDTNGDTSPPLSGTASNLFAPKPAVGSDEWHKIRRDNHKEVERRRRETINEGINELAKIVPGCEKNKGSILARAVQFITQLKENETQNIEKWTLEKLLTEQAIAELSSSCDKLKAECQRAWAECEQWKKGAQKAGVTVDTDEKGDADAEDAD